jgi:hypothetical protein
MMCLRIALMQKQSSQNLQEQHYRSTNSEVLTADRSLEATGVNNNQWLASRRVGSGRPNPRPLLKG